ncbi:MAG: PAS domain-containing protein [Desulfobacteraceae bacterium]|nr:MAG: PAS domain-containing protein [Desulfobacteraceae bacterium]
MAKLNIDTTQIILDSISDGVFTIDYHWKITSFNRAAEKITGISREEAIGRHCWDVFRSNMCERLCALKRTMEEGKSFISTSAYIINADRKRVPITASTSLLIDDNGEVLGGVEVFRDNSLEEALRKELSARFEMGDMVSQSDEMKKIFSILPQVSESDATVLIEGETGTGKELLARAIHELSLRRDKPFVAINCGALPDTLLESELFGYKAGAFTHAVKDKPGHFSLANGGTIFLDEIGDTSPAFQVRLLRVLQEHEFQPLGGIRKEKADVRIIAATNKSLEQMVSQNEFRQDLYYRINVISVNLPPLRERLEDVPLLVDTFISRLNKLKGKSIKGVDSEVLRLLMSHAYPGNIRELENIIEHAFVLCNRELIEPSHLPVALGKQISGTAGSENGSSFLADSDPVKAARIKQIMDALKRNGFNRQKAARDLGIHKSTLFRQIKTLGITLDSK